MSAVAALAGAGPSLVAGPALVAESGTLGALAALSCFGLPLAAGWALLRALGVRPASDRLAFWGWAWIAGALACGALTFAWLWSGARTDRALVPASALAVLALGCAALGRRVAPAPRAPRVSAPPLERAFFAALVALAFATSAARVLAGTLRPVVEDDEANFWALKAQMLFAHGGFSEAFARAASEPNRLYNADYPLWNPCLQVWTFAHAGGLLHVWSRLSVQLFGLALVLVLAAALRRVVRPAVAALLVVVLCSVFELGSQLQRAHGDLMVGLGALVAGDAWLRWRAGRHPAWRRLACLGLAAMLWSKNEGQLFLAAAAIGALLLALVRRLDRRPSAAALATDRPPTGSLTGRAAAALSDGRGRAVAWLWALLPALVLALNHAVNARYGWVSGFLSGAGREASIVGLLREQLPARAGPVASYFWREIALAREQSGWILLLLLSLCALFPLRALRSPAALLALVVLGFELGLMLVFVGAPHDLRWHLTNAAQRVAFQPLALATLALGALAGTLLPALAPRREGR